jgi:hypothetical protein
VLGPFARLLRLASIVICLIALASFALFAVSRTNSASSKQQEAISEAGRGVTAPGTPGTPAGNAGGSSHESSLRKAIDDASSTLTSPFAGVTSDSSSEWLTRGIRLLLALAVYGFGLGFLARLVRVRV